MARGRRLLGHEGHRGEAATCDACRLQRLRLRLGLTQPQMARRVGRSLRAYTAYERGETRAVDPAVLMLAETWALGVPEPKGGDDA